MTRVNWLHTTVLLWTIVIVLRFTAIGGEWRPMSLHTWSVILIWIAAYAIGYRLVPRARGFPPASIPTPPRGWFERWIYFLCMGAVIGAALIAYEFAVRRGYGFTTPVALIRAAEVGDAMEGSEGSWISGIGRLLTPALMVSWILAIYCRNRLRKRTWLVLLGATVIVFWEHTMFEGGRFFLAALFLSCLVTRILRPPGVEQRLRPWPWRTIAGIGVPVIGLFGYVFVDRVQTMQLDFAAAYSIFLTSYTIDPTDDALARLNGSASAGWFTLYMFWMYITQGPNELNHLLHYEPMEHAFGLVQFSLIGQGLSKLTGLDISYDQYTNMPNPGTYTTIIGPNYMDFGIVGGWIFAVALGYLTARCAQRMRLGVLHRMGLTAPLVVSVSLFSPIVSLVVNVWPAFVWACLVGATARYGFWQQPVTSQTPYADTTGNNAPIPT